MRPRPRVRYVVVEGPEEVLERFRVALAEPGSPCTGSVGRREITLRIAGSNQRRWSPWLQVDVQALSGGTELNGTMGPQPKMWTAFVFVYACMLVLCVSGSVYGFVQTTLQQSPTGLVAAVVGLVGLAGFCGLDLLGRRLGEGQMGIIRGFLLRTVPALQELDEDGSPAVHDLDG